MKKEQLFELTESNFIISEKEIGEAKVKTLVAHGMMLDTEKPTLNRRKYPTEITSKALTKYNEDYVAKNSAYMLDGHPDVSSSARPSDVVARLISTHMEGKRVMGEFAFIGTNNGKDVKAIVESGGNIGISLRGNASVSEPDKEGVVTVLDDFRLFGFDIVLNPASSEAGIAGYRYEHKNHEGGDNMKKLEDLMKEHPDLMKEYKEQVTKEAEAEFTKKLEGMKDEIAKEISDELEKDLKAKAEAYVEEEALEVSEDGKIECPICEARLPVSCPASGEESEAVESLKKELTGTKTSLKTAEESAKKMSDRVMALESANTKMEVEKYLSENLSKIEDEKLRSVLTTKIGVPSSIKEAEAIVKKELDFLNTLTESGVANIAGGSRSRSIKTVEEEAEQRKIALSGID